MAHSVAVVVLAAGKGTRMKSDTPKVLHSVCGVPMLGHILNTVHNLRPARTIVIAGHQRELIEAYVDQRAEVVYQMSPCGTGHALLQVNPQLHDFDGIILVLGADAPLIQEKTLKKLIQSCEPSEVQASVLSFVTKNPQGYGRIVRDGNFVSRIVEESQATEEEKKIQEVNSGVYAFKASSILGALQELKPDPIKNEIYLTDAVEVLFKQQADSVRAIQTSEPWETLGVNSRKELAEVTQIKKQAILDALMVNGVTVEDPATTFVGEGVVIGKDTVLHPHTVIEGPCTIGEHCQIGPFAHIRAHVTLGNAVCVGNFVEIVRSTIGNETLVKHLSYVGDAEVGPKVNVGAGTITANYDGKDKHQTVIEAEANIGSGTILVAPIRVGKGARTGAGSVIPSKHDIPAGTTVIGMPAKPLNKKD